MSNLPQFKIIGTKMFPHKDMRGHSTVLTYGEDFDVASTLPWPSDSTILRFNCLLENADLDVNFTMGAVWFSLKDPLIEGNQQQTVFDFLQEHMNQNHLCMVNQTPLIICSQLFHVVGDQEFPLNQISVDLPIPDPAKALLIKLRLNQYAPSEDMKMQAEPIGAGYIRVRSHFSIEF